MSISLAYKYIVWLWVMHRVVKIFAAFLRRSFKKIYKKPSRTNYTSTEMLKEVAKKKKLDSQILATIGYGNFIILDDYHGFLKLINEGKESYCEYTPDNVPVNMFYDLDAAESPSAKFSDTDKEKIVNAYNNPKLVAEEVISKTCRFFENLGLSCKFMVLSAHGWSAEKKVNKMSFHIIVKLQGSDNQKVFVKNMEVAKAIAKSLFPELLRLGIVDEKVYKGERVFRTIGSSKPGENRPLVKCLTLSSSGTTDMDSFLCYGPVTSDSRILNLPDLGLTENRVIIGPKIKKQKMIHSSSSPQSISESEIIALLDNLDEKYFTDRNYWLQVCHILICIGASLDVWLTFSSKWDSYDEKAATSAFLSIKRKHETDNPGHTIDDLRKLKTKSLMDEVVIANGGQEFISLSNYSFMDKIKDFDYDKLDNSYKCCVGDHTRDFFFKHINCVNPAMNHNALHFARNNEFGMECQSCGCVHGPFNIPAKYTNLTVIFNNNTVINNYNGGGQEDFGCEVQIDSAIFNDQICTDIINQILDGHKICDVARLLKVKYDVFVYDKKMKDWYFFNGFKWVEDGSLDFKDKVLEARTIFNDILVFYKDYPLTEILTNLRKNVKNLIKKMSDPGFKTLALEEAKLCFREPDFSEKLNCKKHLLPCTNGVYDLLAGEFRTKVKKDEYIELTVGYDYNPTVSNPAVFEFLESVLPDESVRDYMLKSLSDCLNGNRPNTIFHFLIGIGSNGKTQLMNLMCVAMGQFHNKTNSAIFTRKRPDANAPSPSLMDLRNKRFACASETEDGEQINLSLLKEITGSESSIQGRRLQENTTEFQMHAKFFLSTNYLPEIKGEGPAVWRRIRVIDFPTNFVESPDPLNQNERKADIDIPSRIKEDITWRQTFLNILLSYYNRDVPPPQAVLALTAKYREENNEIEQWCKDNIVFKDGGILELTELNNRRFGSDYSNRRVKGQFRKCVEKVLKKLGEEIEGFDHKCINRTTAGATSQKWLGVVLIE